MSPTPASPRPGVQRLAVSPRVIDWSQLRYRLIWVYAGRPASCEKSPAELGLTAWRISRGKVVLHTPGGLTAVGAGQWVLLPAKAGEKTFSPETEIVSIRFHASWADGRALFDPVRPLVATALQAECLSPSADELARFVRQRIT